MSLSELVQETTDGRSDKVEAAYKYLRNRAAAAMNLQDVGGEWLSAEEELQAFQEAIQDEVAYGHQAIANALNNLGFKIDRRQVHNFREKLKLGKVAL